jgi:hypothetical protein
MLESRASKNVVQGAAKAIAQCGQLVLYRQIIRWFSKTAPQEAGHFCETGFIKAMKSQNPTMSFTTALAATLVPVALDELCISALRFLAVDMVQKTDSGHLGLPLGSAAMAYALGDRSLQFTPHDPS